MQTYSLQQLDASRCALTETLNELPQLDFAVIETCPSFTGIIVRALASQTQLIPEQSEGIPVFTYPQKKVIDLNALR